MRQKVRNWMDEKLIALQGAVIRKSEGMGTVEVILIICYILTI